MTDADDPVPPYIHVLERMLSVAVIVRDIEPGPPAEITAAGMVDGDVTTLIGRGPDEAAAWRDLASAIAAWRNMDARLIRTIVGGMP
jgi:hypothetical protein